MKANLSHYSIHKFKNVFKKDKYFFLNIQNKQIEQFSKGLKRTFLLHNVSLWTKKTRKVKVHIDICAHHHNRNGVIKSNSFYFNNRLVL